MAERSLSWRFRLELPPPTLYLHQVYFLEKKHFIKKTNKNPKKS